VEAEIKPWIGWETLVAKIAVHHSLKASRRAAAGGKDPGADALGREALETEALRTGACFPRAYR
jgi:hypothetical protein